MDKIQRITKNAFINYYNILRQVGQVQIQDKGKLAILYFFYYLKYKSDYLYDLISDPQQTSIGVWTINRERERELMVKFDNILTCLAKDSCFVKLLNGDRCVINNQPTWQFPTGLTVFISNDEDVTDGYIDSFIPNDDNSSLNDNNLNPLIPN